MLVIDMHPLNMVEGKGFKNLISVVEPHYSVPTRKFILKKHIRGMYHSTVEQIKEEISSGVHHAVTTDGW